MHGLLQEIEHCGQLCHVVRPAGPTTDRPTCIVYIPAPTGRARVTECRTVRCRDDLHSPHPATTTCPPRPPISRAVKRPPCSPSGSQVMRRQPRRERGAGRYGKVLVVVVVATSRSATSTTVKTPGCPIASSPSIRSMDQFAAIGDRTDDRPAPYGPAGRGWTKSESAASSTKSASP